MSNLDELKELFGENIIIMDPGDVVLCDLCNKDYTNLDELGGFVFNGNAVCPDCSAEFLEEIKKYGEEIYINSYAKVGETFKDFILRYRENGR